ncbi:PP2C family protein-serine/threonine phosphatase [Nocardiopsis mangrovi]|uniref:PP2C family protein-serine/threonine phosphatase n=1 Tax=Nocardiopsis mangrovi TaxID=1179818 RepID=A0ABV9E417_9ACTN
MRRPEERDHVEVASCTAAGVSDRGLRHRRNEDAMVLVAPGVTAPALVAVAPVAPVPVPPAPASSAPAVPATAATTRVPPGPAVPASAGPSTGGDAAADPASAPAGPAPAPEPDPPPAPAAAHGPAGPAQGTPGRGGDALFPVRSPARRTDAQAVVAVVCDGVSTLPRPHEASRIAADTGAAVLAAGLAAGGSARDSTEEAMRGAAAAVAGLADSGPEAPACTFVSAVVPADGGPITLGWIGDSRAYWLAAPGAATPSTLLTRDDSWGEAMVAMDVMTPAQARASVHSHALTAWMGADFGPVDGHLETVDLQGPGTLLLCSDGLWNYLPRAHALAAAVPDAADDPLEAARTFVRFALDSGGGDNITAVVIAVPAPPGHNGACSEGAQ